MEKPTEPTNKDLRKLYHILSHGQRSTSTLKRILSEPGSGQESKRKKIRKFSKQHDWIREVSENGKTYFYREDIGREPIPVKPPADGELVDKILTDLEIQLGIKSRNRGYTKSTPTLIESFEKFCRLSIEKGVVFPSDYYLNRFFTIFDKLMEEIKKSYPANQEPRNRPTEVYMKVFIFIANQHESWKDGQANNDFDQRISQQLSDLVDLLSIVPPKIGNHIMRILVIIDINKARDGFKNILLSNKYSKEKLLNYAFHCYITTGKTDNLIDELADIGATNDHVQKSIRYISDKYYNY